MASIIGRKQEQAALKKIWRSRNPELVAIYGRRRVGKTFLVRELFSSMEGYFELTGMKDVPLEEQLRNFATAFSAAFYPELTLQPPKNWRDAFTLLTTEITRTPSKKIVLFFDEVPWLSSNKSRFFQTLDYFWNTHWSRMANVKVILCGSAASWMLEHLINAKGGLHNRITCRLQLHPFNLRETKEYLVSRKIKLNDLHILDLYMVMGGIPYYLNFIERGKSAEQNIQDICFSKNAVLLSEFERLFHSLFDAAEINLRLIREIAKKREGISRDDLIKATRMSSGGTFNKRMNELQAAGFIQGFIPFHNIKKDQHFRVIDEYSIFYLKWIDPVIAKGFPQNNYWKMCSRGSQWDGWGGYAFECVCFKHIPQILKALHLESITCQVGNWRYRPKRGSKTPGVQVDLLFDRLDNAVTLCEIKYCSGKFGISKGYAKELHQKMDIFLEITGTKKQLFLALITTLGLKQSLWNEELVTNEITLQDLFTF